MGRPATGLVVVLLGASALSACATSYDYAEDGSKIYVAASINAWVNTAPRSCTGARSPDHGIAADNDPETGPVSHLPNACSPACATTWDPPASTPMLAHCYGHLASALLSVI